MSIEKGRAYFRQFGMEDRVREFDVSSATVELAALALGVDGARIAKTLSFKKGDSCILILAAGDARIDNHKFKDKFHMKAKMLAPDEVLTLVGHPVGGVCPFGINDGIDVYLDESLKRFETVFPAVGSGNSAIELNLDELYRIASAEQIIKACASFASNALGISQTPTLEQINSMLAQQAWLGGLQLRVIDQDITRELADGTTTTGNPFENHRIVLSETEKLGSTQYDILGDDDSSSCILRAVRSHTVIKKYGTIEPKSEVTIGEADAIPVLDSAYRNIYVRTDRTEW